MEMTSSTNGAGISPFSRRFGYSQAEPAQPGSAVSSGADGGVAVRRAKEAHPSGSGEQAGVQRSDVGAEEFTFYSPGSLYKKNSVAAGAGHVAASTETRSGTSEPATGNGAPALGAVSPNGVKTEKTEKDPRVQAAIAQLKSIEEKVKAHEAAHKSAGGAMTGPISYSYTRGPDGKNYITGGEVPINVSPGKTPRETISRMQQVIQAALAPADPSPQDRAVAAQAAAQQLEASRQAAEASSPGTSEAASSSSVIRTSQQAYNDPAVTGKSEDNSQLSIPQQTSPPGEHTDSNRSRKSGAGEHGPVSYYA